MQLLKRGIVYLIIIVGVISIVNATRAKPDFTPHGIALPLQQKPTATMSKTSPDQIRDFRVPPPLHYKKLAKIYVQTHFISASPEIEKASKALANTLASESGANAMIIETMGFSQANPEDKFSFLSSRFMLSGIAIHVDSSNNKKETQ